MNLALRQIPIRIAIVKWDTFSGEAIAKLIREEFVSARVVVFQSAAEALEALRLEPVDVGIFGLTLPDIDGLDLLEIVSRERLADRRLIMTWRTDERVRHVLKRSAIHGVIETISDGPERLLVELKRVLSAEATAARIGGTLKTIDISSELLDQILSDRELQVLAVLADGSDDHSAAEALRLSPATVHTHRQRIMSKLGVQTRVALVREAMRRGVIRFTEDGALHPGLESVLADNKAAAKRRK